MATATCLTFQCADLDPYPAPADCVIYTGGANQIVLLKCGLSVDVTDGPAVLAAITAGDAVKYTGLTVSYEPPSPLTTPSLVAGLGDITTKYDLTVNIVDRNVTQGTVDHYNSIASSTGFTFGGLLIFEMLGDGVGRTSYIDDATIVIEGGKQFPADEALQSFQLQAKFKSTRPNLKIMTTNPAGLWT